MTDLEQSDPKAQPFTAAGVLFFDTDGRVLLVRPSYKPGWEIPGGYIQPNETPTEAAAREVLEEIGITPPIGPLLVADWAPAAGEGDKVLFVFDGGVLAQEYIEAIKLDPGEIADYAFHDPALIGHLTIPRMARRLTAAFRARAEQRTLYLEHGEPR